MVLVCDSWNAHTFSM